MNGRNRWRDTFRAMGTTVETDIVVSGSKDELKSLFREIREVFFHLERIFSRFLAESELSKLNAALGKECVVSRDMFDVLELSLRFSEETDGLFDPRILPQLLRSGYVGDFFDQMPKRESSKSVDEEIFLRRFSEDIFLDTHAGMVWLEHPIDLGGIAKGYAVQTVADRLYRQGFSDFVIDAGGDMFAAGHDEDNDPWLVALEGVDESEARWCLSNKAVATSGMTRRSWDIDGRSFHHLVDPRSPTRYDFSLQTVSVVADSVGEADVLAKTYFLLGTRKGLRRANRLGHVALFLDRHNHITQSDACAEFLDQY